MSLIAYLLGKTYLVLGTWICSVTIPEHIVVKSALDNLEGKNTREMNKFYVL